MKLLYIDCCISQRGTSSRTLSLANAFWDVFRAEHPEAEVETVRLETLNLKPLTPADLNRRDTQAGNGDFTGPDFRLARSFQQADKIVVAAPFWDLSFPAVLRIYIEHISANGLTYHYESDGCHGDCRASRLLYITTGGDLERPHSLGVLYWKQLCAMFGIPRFEYVFAGGLDLNPAQTPEILKTAREQVCRLARDF